MVHVAGEDEGESSVVSRSSCIVSRLSFVVRRVSCVVLREPCPHTPNHYGNKFAFLQEFRNFEFLPEYFYLL
jgi:hypothetical protein